MPNSWSIQRRSFAAERNVPCQTRPPAQKKRRGLQIRARSGRHDVVARFDKAPESRTTS